MGKTVYCLSNGSSAQFPNNTLTKFGNKFPFLFDYQTLTDSFKFHVALEAIGFSLNLDRKFLPNVNGNPSIILKLKTSVKVSSKCFSLTGQTCNIFNEDLLDSFHSTETKNSTNSFVYLFLDKGDLTYEKIVKFFTSLSELTDLSVYHNSEKKLIKLKQKKEEIIALFNLNLLDYLNVETSFLNDPGSLLTQELVNKWKDRETRISSAGNFNGDKYFHFLIDSKSETHIDLTPLLKPVLPKIIKIKCNEIKNQILNENMAKDLIIFCPEINTKTKYFWHEFEAKTYCVLQNTLLQNITFELTDENDQLLPLNVGIPTILKLDIQAMDKSKKSFNVRVTSNTSLHPENTRSSFTITLPQTLTLNSDWKVGLSSVNIPNSFNTFPSALTMSFLYYVDVAAGKRERIDHFFPHRRYTKSELLNEVNQFLIKNKQNQYIGEMQEKEPENRHEKVICLSMKKPGTLSFSKSLAYVLGFTNVIAKRDKVFFTFSESGLKSEIEHFADEPMNIDFYRPSYYMLYSNMVQPTAVSGEYLNVLKVFPVSNEDTSYVIQEFKHREYLGLSNFDIKEITFHLRSHTGEFISFDNNKKDPVILNLHFTNYA